MEPRYNEDFGIMNDYLYSSNSEISYIALYIEPLLSGHLY